MILFEIHQKFKGHFLNELRVSFELVFYEILWKKNFSVSFP